MPGIPVASFGPPTQITDGATQTIDCSQGSQFLWTLGANRTVSTFTNPAPGQIVHLHVKQDATGSRTLTWPSNVAWPSATAPTLTTTAAKVDVFQFIYDAATLVWRGSTVGLNYT
jgi:hypothetical protein